MPNKFAFCLGYSDNYGGKGYPRLPFAYKNIADMTVSFGRKKGYQFFPTIPEMSATKAVVKNYLLEKINGLAPDDWLLFYYVGHGEIKANPASGNGVTTYLVTSFKDYQPSLGFDNFFTDDDYQQVIGAFQQKCPQGHLITILDCCYAFGLIDQFGQQESFHTILAASTFDRKAYYDTNSFFYQGLSVMWDKPLNKISTDLPKYIKTLYDKSKCECRTASLFFNQGF